MFQGNFGWEHLPLNTPFLVGISMSSWVEESITEGNSEKKQVG